MARFAYDDAGNLALVMRNGHEYVVVTDQLGSPLMLVDAQGGQVAEQIAYDPWGGFASGACSYISCILSPAKPSLF